MTHRLRMVGDLKVRSVYIRPDARPDLPAQCQVAGISPLLRELILAAIKVEQPYAADLHGGRLMNLHLDEVAVLSSLPLRLPQPTDPDLLTICESLVAAPDDASTLGEWAGKLGVDPKTIQRRFARQTGMTCGPVTPAGSAAGRAGATGQWCQSGRCCAQPRGRVSAEGKVTFAGG